jgi:hypothetical protein
VKDRSIFLPLPKICGKMAKYRLLTQEELKPLEDDFVKFLSANTVVADGWDKIKKEDPKKAEGLIEIFSDIVWEKALEKIKCLEARTEKDMKVFNFPDEESMEMIHLKIGKDKDFSLVNQEDLKKVTNGEASLADFDPELFTGKRDLKEDRKREIFEMMEQGCTPCPEALYYALENMIESK